MKVFDGTSWANARRILCDGFRSSEKSVINDLGNAIYTYCEDWYHIWDPAKNAEQYARQYCNGKICVLELEIDADSPEVKFIDLDQIILQKQWEDARKKLEKRANQIWRTFPPGKAKQRHNLHGIMLEIALDHQLLHDDFGVLPDPDFWVKNTYTSFIPPLYF